MTCGQAPWAPTSPCRASGRRDGDRGRGRATPIRARRPARTDGRWPRPRRRRGRQAASPPRRCRRRGSGPPAARPARSPTPTRSRCRRCPAALQPPVSLDYNSQSVDGLTSSTNDQASWIGDGWDYEPGLHRAGLQPAARPSRPARRPDGQPATSAGRPTTRSPCRSTGRTPRWSTTPRPAGTRRPTTGRRSSTRPAPPTAPMTAATGSSPTPTGPVTTSA